MKITSGIDIIEVKRIQESIENVGENFINKIYTPLEIEYCNSKKHMKYQHFAARFAAKEAIFKAISEVLQNKYEITWTDVQIVNNEQGKPQVEFLNKKFCTNIEQIDISLSHLKGYATAMCVIIIK